MAGVTLSFVCNGPRDDAFGQIFFFFSTREETLFMLNCTVNTNADGAVRNVFVCVCVFAPQGLWTLGRSPVEISTCSFETFDPPSLL